MILDTTSNLPAQIYHDLKHKIEEFEYKPGERLSEPSLAKHYGISRTPIKQAITILEVQGVVVVKPNSGTFVSKIDTEHLAEFFTMRKLLEIGILDEFKNSFKPLDLVLLQENLKKQDQLASCYNDSNRVASSKMFWLLDNEFHRIIFKTVNKEFLWHHIVEQSLQANRFRVLSVSVSQEDLQIKVDEHHKIYSYLTGNQNLDVNSLYDDHLFKTLENNIRELQLEFPNYFN